MKALDVAKPHSELDDPDLIWPLEVAMAEADDPRDVAPEIWAEIVAEREAKEKAERRDRSRRQNNRLRRSGRRMMRSIKEAIGGRTDT